MQASSGGAQSDPGVRYPIPSERDVMLEWRMRGRQVTSGEMRSIGFRGEGSGVRVPTDLPYKATGLKWKGRRAVTRSGLHGMMNASEQAEGSAL